jgi:GNAT superfamily N-acetyltransferase
VTGRPGSGAGGASDGAGLTCRPATGDDLDTCAAIWRDALNDYLGRLAQPEIPDDLGPILRLYAHLRTTDPTTFVVAERAGRAGRGGAAIDGFAVAVRRDGLWFLSMLFVRPAAQARGLGRMLLDAVAPTEHEDGGGDAAGHEDIGNGPGNGPVDRRGRAALLARATATDSVQPISNGLYGSLGMVPRMPLLRMVGLPTRPGTFPALPDGVEPIGFDEVGDDVAEDRSPSVAAAARTPSAPTGGGGRGLERSALDGELAALDTDAVGFSRAVDHAYHATEGRRGFLYRGRDGAAVAYGYTSEAGRIGPVATRDPSLLGPIVGHLVHAVRPRGAFGVWVPGAADAAVVPLLRAGFRFEGFPVLLCWDRPFADFARYVPMSPGLL